MRVLLAFFLLIALNGQSHGQHWEGVAGGTESSGIVFSLFEWDNNLSVNGSFFNLNGGSLPCLLTGSWNNSNWGCNNWNIQTGVPYDHEVINGQLYIGGDFPEVNGNSYCNKVARLDSSGRSSLGYGVTGFGRVNCITTYNNDLFIGGIFNEVDSTISAWRIARWDGTSWHAMGTGVQGGFGVVNDMAVYQNELYVGGDFTSIDGVTTYGIGRWDGMNWSSVGSGASGRVNSLYVDSVNNRLYAGGHFTQIGGISCPTGVAYWDGSNWFPVGTNPFLPAKDLIIYNGILYNLSFEFDAVNSNNDTIDYAAWYDGINWNPVPGGLSSTGNCFSIYQNELYVGGYFQYAGDSLVNGIAKWIPGSLGITGFSDLNITISPNPFRDHIQIQSSTDLTRAEFIIYDVLGKKVFRSTIEREKQINIPRENISGNLYIYKILKDNTIIKTGKLVAQ